MFNRMDRILVLALLAGVAGCASVFVPSGVDPLPYYRTDGADRKVHSLELCRLYKKYGFVEGSCTTEEWVVKKFDDAQLTSEVLRSARNEVQHAILGLATSQCSEFKQSVTGRARGQLLGSETLALLLSAGAAFAGSEKLTKGLAAGAGAVAGFSGLMEDGYANELETALLGIEIARTRVFFNILYEQKSSLLDYPLSRAVNDAMRYHSVCNLTEGMSEASRALSEELQEVPERRKEPPENPSGEAGEDDEVATPTTDQ